MPKIAKALGILLIKTSKAKAENLFKMSKKNLPLYRSYLRALR